MATREEAKLQRRQAIMDAARSLMQESGTAGFSMRNLAELAGVSIATPYNLFGSKQAIMIAILEIELQAYRKEVERIRADDLEVLFKAVTLATGHYAAEPGFYRALLFSIYNDGGTDFRSMFSGTSHALWRSLVERAIAAGHLADEVEPNAFAINLGHIFFACILEWVYGQLTMEELEIRVQYGFALSLLAMAQPASAPRLRERVLTMQKRLWKIWTRNGAGNGESAKGARGKKPTRPATAGQRRRQAREPVTS
jgi:AcrR family transcriptional regulator